MDNSLKASILRGAIGLGLFAMVTAGIIAVTHEVTADDIALAEAQARARSLYTLIPENATDVPILDTAFDLEPGTALGLRQPTPGYRAIRQGKVEAVILPFTAREGYNGDIHGIAAIRADGTLIGVQIISHKETPGLGDQVEARKSGWLRQFQGASLQNPPRELWKVKKDGGAFDQLTGATITPRAIVSQLTEVLAWFSAHRDELLKMPADKQEAP
ncbi:RnfABCDGE type electron transport complex subunit G [Hahella sp. SMD15-11]|uniref:Ion-translocating oxidoreductase complex subunit G n=1 Tax=Thermohahella caldifontis TaxID=3142973 RepID=A0AB39UZX8_9GAMM